MVNLTPEQKAKLADIRAAYLDIGTVETDEYIEFLIDLVEELDKNHTITPIDLGDWQLVADHYDLCFAYRGKIVARIRRDGKIQGTAIEIGDLP